MVGVIAQSNNYGVQILHDDDESNKKRGPDILSYPHWGRVKRILITYKGGRY